MTDTIITRGRGMERRTKNYEEGPKILEIPIDEIVQEDNLRAKYGKEEMGEMMASLKASGQLQPISLKKRSDGKFRVVFGNRRLTAIKKLGWDTVRATLSESETDRDEMIEHIVENLQRVDIPMADEGRGYDKLRETMSVTEIAVRVGKTAARVRDALNTFHRMPEKYRGKIKQQAGQSTKGGRISPTLAKTVVGVLGGRGDKGAGSGPVDADNKEKLWEYATQDGITAANVRMVGKLISRKVPFERALELSRGLKTVSLDLFMMEDGIRALEEKTGQNIHELIESWISTNPDFELVDLRDKLASRPRKEEASKDDEEARLF